MCTHCAYALGLFCFEALAFTWTAWLEEFQKWHSFMLFKYFNQDNACRSIRIYAACRIRSTFTQNKSLMRWCLCHFSKRTTTFHTRSLAHTLIQLHVFRNTCVCVKHSLRFPCPQDNLSDELEQPLQQCLQFVSRSRFKIRRTPPGCDARSVDSEIQGQTVQGVTTFSADYTFGKDSADCI